MSSSLRAPSTSVLIASYARPKELARCLIALTTQTVMPTEVLVVWQGNDTGTRGRAEELAPFLPYKLRIMHSEKTGIVPAENLGLANARGQIVLMIDDDAVPDAEWIEAHLSHYEDGSVGAVGGPARNHKLDGTPFPTRTAEKIGQLSWYGKLFGNLFDHARTFGTIEVDHLAGGNMSFRRNAIGRFDDRLKPYWQYFEAEACLQVKAAGYRILYDSENAVMHYPISVMFDGTREGDLVRKVFNPSFNHAFVLAKHSSRFRLARLIYLLGVGSVPFPGLLGFFFAVWRYGNPRREFSILVATLRAHLAGWIAGCQARSTHAVRQGLTAARSEEHCTS